jgi:methylamine dehydrogenase heavy chain
LAAASGFAYDPAVAQSREPTMRTLQLRAALLALMAGGGAFAAQPLPPEQLSIEPLPAKSPHWVFVIDEAFFNEIDSRVRLFDGDSYRHLGQIDAGFSPGVIQSPDGTTTAVATTYYARGGHGARTDVVEFTDNSTLARRR